MTNSILLRYHKTPPRHNFGDVTMWPTKWFADMKPTRRKGNNVDIFWILLGCMKSRHPRCPKFGHRPQEVIQTLFSVWGPALLHDCRKWGHEILCFYLLSLPTDGSYPRTITGWKQQHAGTETSQLDGVAFHSISSHALLWKQRVASMHLSRDRSE